MGFLIFLLIFGAVCFFLFIVLGILGLFFGGKDHYKHERWAEERHRELCDTIRESGGGDQHLHLTDARQVINIHERTDRKPKRYDD